ncbi:MAG: hypothetical protein OZ921_02275 [Sorangiineae bacterium]|nr:hypothetical protein [Polyangiaceae bacterium]MEB2321311.1 hypothetical protein [Sorangiineae bacterium]
MLTRDVRIEGFTATDWLRLAELVRPARERPGEGTSRVESSARGDVGPARRRGGVIAITVGAELRKLLSTEQARLELDGEPWPVPLAELAARHGVRWAVAVSSDALEELTERFADRLRREHDLLAQGLLLVGILRELAAEGAISAWPWHPASWPVPRERVLLRALDALCPDGKTLLVGAFHQGELATCLAAHRRATGFDRLVGPGLLRREMGLVSGDWRRDYRHLARAAERTVGELANGCFGELDTFRRLVEEPRPGAWAAAVAARDIVLSPAVPAIAVPLGVDAGRAALASVRALADRLGATNWLEESALLRPALERMRELTPGRDELERLLGFDPIVLVRRLLGRGD